MDDGSPGLGLILFVVFIVIYLLVFGFSAAIQAINESEILKRKEEGQIKAKKIMDIVSNPTKYINTVLVIVVTCALILGVTAFPTYAGMLTGVFCSCMNHIVAAILGYILTAFVMIVLILSLGIVIPKKVAGRHAVGWAFLLINIISFFVLILTPATFILGVLSKIILKLFRIDIDEDLDEVTEEEIMSMVNEGHEQGTILASEAEMITNIFELADKDAQDIMTNRKNIVAINGEWTLEETVRFILDESNSRFPVYIESIDNIIGIIYLRDVMTFNNKKTNKSKMIKDIPNIMRKAYFIPETRSIDALFRDMQSEKIHMKMVVDEYGQTAGLVTMEDILEEIVGNIFDEYDEIEDNIIKQEDGTYILSGMTPLEEIEDELGVEYGEHDYDTLNGFLISNLDRIPNQDERPEINVNGYEYKILGIDNKTISQVLLKLPEETKEEKIQEEEEL